MRVEKDIFGEGERNGGPRMREDISERGGDAMWATETAVPRLRDV
jgi:hypothetical protein